MDDITPRDRREVEKWVVRMLDDPERHRAALSRWTLEKPGRRALYEQLMCSVEDAGQALSTPVDPIDAPVLPHRRSTLFSAAAAVLLLAVACGAAFYFWLPEYPFMNRVGWCFVAGMVIAVAISLMSPKRETALRVDIKNVDFSTGTGFNISAGIVVAILAFLYYIWR